MGIVQTIGIIGGMSWHSTQNYYRILNTRVQESAGAHHSARVLIDSLDFEDVRRLQLAEDWDAAGVLLAEAGRRLEAAGADGVLIATNLMHKVAPAVEAALEVPLLHIADAVGAAARARGFERLAILGTAWVMGETFYTDRLARHGLDALTPPRERHAAIDAIIFDELTLGIVRDDSRAVLLAEIAALADAGAQAVVLACTELELSITEENSPLPVLDSMATHALAAAEFCLG